MTVVYFKDDSEALAHYGVKGMKWGVRRYRNEDGSLTNAGKKRYLQGHSDAAYKDLKKQVRKQRKEVRGNGNQWQVNTPIGEHSKRYLDTAREKENAYKSSKEYKAWEKKMNTWQKEAEKRFERDNSPEFWNAYENAYNDLMAKRPKRNFSSPYEAGVTINGLGAKGRTYTKGYLQGAGRDLSIAYLRDLGYNQKTAEQLVAQMIRQNRTLGFV